MANKEMSTKEAVFMKTGKDSSLKGQKESVKPIKGDKRYKQNPPLGSVAFLASKAGDRGSGFLVKIGLAWIIITAAHCVWDTRRHAIAKCIEVFLGRKTEKDTVTFKVDNKAVNISHKYLSGDCNSEHREHDFAIIYLGAFQLNSESFQPVSLDINDVKSTSQDRFITGYPREVKRWFRFKDSPVYNQYSVKLTDIEVDTNRQLLIYSDATSGGMSGAPLYFRNEEGFYSVFGIHVCSDNGAIWLTNDKILEIENEAEKFFLEDAKRCLVHFMEGGFGAQLVSLEKELLEMLNKVANDRGSEQRNLDKAKLGSNVTGGVGSVLAIVGLALAPVTFGASIGLTIAGGVVGGLGAVSSISSVIIDHKFTKKNWENILQKFKEYSENIKRLREDLLIVTAVLNVTDRDIMRRKLEQSSFVDKESKERLLKMLQDNNVASALPIENMDLLSKSVLTALSFLEKHAQASTSLGINNIDALGFVKTAAGTAKTIAVITDVSVDAAQAAAKGVLTGAKVAGIAASGAGLVFDVANIAYYSRKIIKNETDPLVVKLRSSAECFVDSTVEDTPSDTGVQVRDEYVEG